MGPSLVFLLCQSLDKDRKGGWSCPVNETDVEGHTIYLKASVTLPLTYKACMWLGFFFFLPEQCGPSWSRCIPQHWGPWQEGSQGDYCRRSPWRRNRACTSSGLLKHRDTLSNKNIQLNLEEVTLDQTSMTVMMGITWLDKKTKQALTISAKLTWWKWILNVSRLWAHIQFEHFYWTL